MVRVLLFVLAIVLGALASPAQDGSSLPGLSKLQEEADAAYGAGKFALAEPLYRALAGRMGAQQPAHPEYLDVLNSLGLALRFQAKYPESERVLQQLLSLTQARRQGTEEAAVRNSLGGLYLDMGNLPLAEREKRASLELYRVHGTPLQVAIGRQNLAVVYVDMGRLTEAQLLYRQALATLRVVKPDGEATAAAMDNLASIYRDTGLQEQARRLQERSLALKLRSGQAMNAIGVATGFHNLALTCHRIGDHRSAERHYREALRRRPGPLGVSAALTLDSLAELLGERGRSEEGILLARQALQIRETSLGPSHWLTGRSHQTLGGLLMQLDRLPEADSEFAMAAGILRSQLGPFHPRVAVAASHLTTVAWRQGRVNDAVRLQAEALTIEEQLLESMAALGGEERKRNYVNTFDRRLDATISLHQTLARGRSDAVRLGLRALLRRKEWMLSDTAAELAALRQRLAPEDRRMVEELASVRGRHAALALRGPGPMSVSAHEAALRDLGASERDLTDRIAQAAAAIRPLGAGVTVDAVQASIPPDGVLVELATYRPLDPAHPDRPAARRLIAYVVRSSGPPVAFDLGPAGALEQRAVRLREALTSPSSNAWQPLARQIAASLLDPLRAAFGDARQLFVAPEGPLSLVPWAVLPDGKGRLALQTWTISYLSSGRDLLRTFQPSPNRDSPLILAAPHFSFADAAPRPNSRSLAFRFRASPIPGTAEEASAIRGLLPGARLLIGDRATEASLKQVRGPTLLHIATHGFSFAPGSPGSRATERALLHGDPAIVPSEPRLRNGLVLAGAASGGAAGEDGLLTALEASSLDLWGTQMVVLSACDTAVGAARRGEALFGLRRAFALAGARSQVVTAWKVEDRATRDLMVAFYRQLRQGKGRAEALRIAQEGLRRAPGRLHPYYWAAFLLSGDSGAIRRP